MPGDVELLLLGGLHPLVGFMNESDYNSTITTQRLASGRPFTLPVTLDIPDSMAPSIRVGSCLQLIDLYSNPVAYLVVEDMYRPNRVWEAAECYGTASDVSHPSVAYLLETSGSIYVGGTIFAGRGVSHHDYPDLRLSPTQVKQEILRRGAKRVIAFQTRNPLHNAHVSLILDALESDPDAIILLHPVVGTTRPSDVPYATRVETYLALLSQGSLAPFSHRIILSVLPLSMRFGGPREAVLHMLIRKNFGATDIIVGRDHAGCKRGDGTDFYDPYAAADLAIAFEKEIGIKVLRFPEMVYSESAGQFVRSDRQITDAKHLSGTQFRALLEAGKEVPFWFSDPAVISQLAKIYPPLHKRGLVVLFVGLSGSGKTTLALSVKQAIETGPFARGGRISLIDGDVVRKSLSSELGFTRQDSTIHLNRMMYVACEIAAQGGVVLVSTIAPIRARRDKFRETVLNEARANFALVYLNTSLSVCRQRDTKGLYMQAANGGLPHMSGVNAPFDPATDANLELPGIGGPIELAKSTNALIQFLMQADYLRNSTAWSPLEIKEYETEEGGEFGTEAYWLRITKNGTALHMVNDIPHTAFGFVNMVTEIPQHTRAKMECVAGVIRHDTNRSGIRFYMHPDPIPVNYGFIPQTLAEDGDPLDVIEVSGKSLETGQVSRVKVIGLLELLDDGHVDNKLIAISADSPAFFNESHPSEFLKRIHTLLLNWFLSYKGYEGKPNIVPVGDAMGSESDASECLQAAHKRWLQGARSSGIEFADEL